MKVVLDGMLLKGRFSGVEVSILELARALSLHGEGTYTLCVPEACPEPDISTETFRTVRYGRTTDRRLSRIVWEQGVLPSIAAREKADVLHAPGYVAPLRARMPVVISVYDLIALQFPAWCTVLNRWHYRLMLPRSIRRATRIVVPSQRTRDDLVQRFPSAADKVRVIPLGVSERYSREAPDGAEPLARHGIEAPFILYAGKLEPKKNVTALVEAFATLVKQGNASLQLVLAGERAWGYAEVERAVRKAGVGDRVVFTGYVPPADQLCLYRAATVFAFPSHYEGFGLPPLEAMASGTPVVAANTGALPEVLGDAATLVAPDDVDGLAAALARVVSDKLYREAVVQRGRERVRACTWERTARATEAVYREAAGL